MKVFWSWQSDSPGKTGRHFIRNALAAAIDELKETEDVEEPLEREIKAALHLDQDRQDIPGSPDLASEIFRKIDSATVFVADVTPVSIIDSRTVNEDVVAEKRNMNPNVAIELGYALRALGSLKFLMVLNTYYGDRRFLPFDLAHKAGPIQYKLAPNAEGSVIKAEAIALKAQFVTALRPYLQTPSANKPVSNFKRTPSSVSNAVYFRSYESLASMGEREDHTEYSYANGNGFYLRLIPMTPLPGPIAVSKLMRALNGHHFTSMYSDNGFHAKNNYGAIVFDPVSATSDELMASTQVFVNGEIWAFAPFLLTDKGYGKIISGQRFEKTFRKALIKYVDFMATSLGISAPYNVQAGAVGLEGFRIAIDDNFDNHLGPILDNDFCVELILNDLTRSAIDQVLIKLFEALFKLTGYERPAGFLGFPA